MPLMDCIPQNQEISKKKRGMDVNPESPPREFEEYKKKYPDFFPDDQPLKKQIEYFKGIQARSRQKEADKKEQFQKLDQVVENKEADNNGRDLVQSGKFIEGLQKQFQKIWCGDGHILLWIVHAFAAGFVTNNDEGLHLYIAGASGLGKSESVKHALTLLPDDYVISGGFSRKGLIYLSENMNSGSIVLMDDHCYDEDEAGIYRAMLAGWRAPGNYYTVDRGSKTVHLKERITQIVTSADGLAELSSDGQNESRFCTIEIRRSGDQMKEIMDFIRAEQKIISKEDKDLLASAWKFIINNPRQIEIPFSGDISIDESAVYKIREFKKFLCLIRASALLHGRAAATQEDFNNAAKMWTYLLLMLDNETAGLAKNERIVFERVSELSNGGKRVHLSVLKNALPTMKEPNIYSALRGRTGSFSNITGGLLSKVRGMSIEKFYDKDTGESDQIIKLNTVIQCQGRSPYSLEIPS
jgi:hypothetical protein